MIRVILPEHLCSLAKINDEVALDVKAKDLRSVIDMLEAEYPMLAGTIRDHVTRKRRPLLRFFACGKDISHEPEDVVLPLDIQSGREPLFIIGAIAGG